ncbi:hypothetical protein ACVILI_004328 [Mesorhizobium sp. USDA 4775]
MAKNAEIVRQIKEHYRDRPVEEILELLAWMTATFPQLRP